MRAPRRRAVAALALAGLALVVVWLAMGGPSALVGHRVAPVRPPDEGKVGASAPSPPSASVAAFAPIEASAHGPEEQQICGGAWIKVAPDGTFDGEPPDFAAAVETLRLETIARLRVDRDEYRRAVATWLIAPQDDAALVALAASTHDPRVYALAFQTCRRAAAGSACGLLSVDQWARLDPGNAAPWVYALDEAASRKDAAGVDEALFQIGRA